MRLTLRIEHVHLHDDLLTEEIIEMANAIEELRREVAEANAGVDSAVALIQGLRDRLDQMVDDSASLAELRAEVEALSGELSASTDELAAAVAAPAEEPAPEPVPDESAGPVENGNVNPGPVVE